MQRPLNDLHGTVLDSFQHVHVCLVEGSLGVDTALQVCLTSAEQTERITFLSLLAMLCPVQPRMLLPLFAARVYC